MKNTQSIIDLVETSLMKAARIGDIEKILKSTDNLNCQNQEGQTALIIAILSNQKEAVKTICNACENLEDAKLMKSQLLGFKFRDEESLNHYSIHRINNVIFQLKMNDTLTASINMTKNSKKLTLS